VFRISDSRHEFGIQRLRADASNNAFTLPFRGDGKFKHHIKATDEGTVHTPDGVRKPNGGHHVVFQHAIDPGFAGLSRAFATENAVAIIKDVFDLIKDQQRLALAEEALRGTIAP